MAPKIQVEIDADTRKFSQGFEKAAGIVRGFLTLGAFVSAAKAAIELGSRISDLSNKAQVSAKWLQEVGYAAKMAGSSMEEVAQAVQELTRAQVQALAGSGSDMNAFKALGISAAELRAANPEQLFDRVAAALKESGQSAESVNAAISVLGRGGKQLVAAMGEGFSQARAEAHDLGVVLSDETVVAMDELGDRLDTLSLGFTAFSANVLKTVMSLNHWVHIAKAAIQLIGVGSRLSIGGALVQFAKGGWTGLASNFVMAGADFSNLLDEYNAGDAAEQEAWRERMSKRNRGGPGGVRGSGKGEGRAITADALQRIGIYVGGSGSNSASLLNTQRQALSVLRSIDTKMTRRAGGRFEQ